MSHFSPDLLIGRKIFSVLILILCSSCMGPQEIPEPKDLLAEDIYIDLLIEIQQIIIYHASDREAVNADSLTILVYDKYDVTEEEFLISHEYYQRQVEKQIERVEEALERLKAEETMLQAHIDSVREVNAIQDSMAQPDTSIKRIIRPDQPGFIEKDQ